jgi:16S rRNA (guanine966-N2)-methyltransferase
MQIIGGAKRGAKLAECKSSSVRPTGQRIREAIFNIVAGGRFTPMIPNTTILDLFAGTGALGLEALSRGASEAYFVERDKQALDTLRANIRKLDYLETTTILAGSVENITRWAYPPADIVFCDAPYGDNITSQALHNMAKTGAIKNGGLVIAEMPKSEKLVLPDEFKFADERSYGITSIHLFNWIPD